MSKTEASPEWYTSTEARRVMKVSTCHLSHMRQDGLLRFQKKGNAFLYLASDVQAHAREKTDHAG